MNTEKLRNARKQKGLSQEELAYQCQVSRQAVSKWESGQSVPDADNLILISKALSISIDDLLDNDYEETHIKMKFDYHDFMEQEAKFSIYEYKSKFKIGQIPLIHIHYTRGMYGIGYGRRFVRRKQVAKGIIAIGDIAIGVVALGLVSLGLFSIGLLSIGLVGLGILSLSPLSFGIFAIGMLSVGVIAIGLQSLGVIAFGLQLAVGVVAIGDVACGIAATGHTLTLSVGDQNNLISGCLLDGSLVRNLKDYMSQHWIWWPLRKIIEMMITC